MKLLGYVTAGLLCCPWVLILLVIAKTLGFRWPSFRRCPCAFCGGTGNVFVVRHRGGGQDYVRCPSCRGRGRTWFRR